MAEATDQQMQTYADTRVRVGMEQLRSAEAAMRDNKDAIEAVFERSVGANPWNDARMDGPPKLLTQQDMLVYNSVITLLLKCIDGTATGQDITDLAANWPVAMSACVRPINQAG